MSAGALAFMAVTWTSVLGLVTFCFVRVLRGPARRGNAATGRREGRSRRKKTRAS